LVDHEEAMIILGRAGARRAADADKKVRMELMLTLELVLLSVGVLLRPGSLRAGVSECEERLE